MRSEHLDAADPANPLVFGNSVYSVKFDAREHDSVYGHRYTFYLQDAVEEVPEYVVHWENFVACALSSALLWPIPVRTGVGSRLTAPSVDSSVAAEYGLEPRFQANFQTIFAEEQEDPYFSNLLRRMNVMDAEGNAEMDEDQLDAASEWS